MRYSSSCLDKEFKIVQVLHAEPVDLVAVVELAAAVEEVAEAAEVDAVVRG